MFYENLNSLLAEAAFDTWIEEVCEPFYAKTGRNGIAPGIYFRMLFVGYFEGIDSQPDIARRCEDSLPLKRFLGFEPFDEMPDHSSLSRIRGRLPSTRPRSYQVRKGFGVFSNCNPRRSLSVRAYRLVRGSASRMALRSIFQASRSPGNLTLVSRWCLNPLRAEARHDDQKITLTHF